MNSAPNQKKSYQKPSLIAFGPVAALTQNGSGNGNEADSGGGMSCVAGNKDMSNTPNCP